MRGKLVDVARAQAYTESVTDDIKGGALARRGYRTVHLPVKAEPGGVAIRMSSRRADALDKIVEDMSLYRGVKLADVMEAVYDQGRKDGARSVFDVLDGAKKEIPHRAPGRPKKN